MRESIFEFLETTFDPAGATVILGTDKTLSSKPTHADLISFGEFFHSITERTLCQHPESSGWCCVPLHREDCPALTGEYVVFVDHPLRGELVLLGDPTNEDGMVQVSPEEFAECELVDRLRFWDPLFFSDGVAEARTVAEAVDTETAVDAAEIDPAAELETLQEAKQVLEYAQNIGQNLPDVDNATLAKLSDEIQSRFNAIRTTRRRTRIARQLEEVEQQVEQGDSQFESGDYKAAKEAYEDAEERIESLRGDLYLEPEDDDEISEVHIQVREKLERVEAAINRRAAEELRRKATRKEAEANKSLKEENYEDARSTLRAARENLNEAKSIADVNPEIAAGLTHALKRVDDQLASVNQQEYRDQIQQQLEEAKRWKRHGDSLFESGEFAEAKTKYDRALVPSRKAADLAADYELLEEETNEMRDAIASRLKESETERHRKEVRELRVEAEELRATADPETDIESAIENLASAKQLLGAALQVAHSTDYIDENNLNEMLNAVSEEHHRLVVTEGEREIRNQIDAADERLQRATDAEENDDLIVALEGAQQAKQEYERIQKRLSDHELVAFGAELKGRQSRAENALQSIRTACRVRVEKLLDTADDAVEQAEAHRDHGDYEDAEEALREALEHYQTAHKFVSGFNRQRVELVRKRFRQTESKIKSIRTISAKLAIQECIQGARECVKSGHSVRDTNGVLAREDYTDALYFIDEAIDIIDRYDFGTTDEIANHNRLRLTRNRNRIEDCRRSLEDSKHRNELPTPSEIKNVTEHLQPPEQQQQDRNVDVERERADIDNFGSDILETIQSQFEDLS